MSSRIITGIALTGVLVLASCMQDQTKAPIVPTSPSFGKNSVSCPFTTIRNNAKGYFSDVKDPVYALIDAMETAFVGTTLAEAKAAATPAGYQVLGRTGNATDLGLVKTTASALSDGNNFVKGVLGCMDVAGYDASTADFTSALGPQGLFAVRAGNLATAVISRGDDVNGKPLFGAEPSGSQWHATAAFILFTGYPVASSTFTSETNGGQAFQLNELPTLTFPNGSTAGPIRAGVCRMEEDARILHEHATKDVILPDANEPNFCTTEPTPTTNVGFKGMMERVGGFFAPKPLYAYAFGGGGSALVSDLSPLGPVTFDVTKFQFVNTIPDAKVKNLGSTQFNSKVAVFVGSSLGTPIANVKVTLDVVGNSGSFTEPWDVERYTDETGVATFSEFYLDKNGGYTITASTTEFGGFTVTSNLFNVTGPK